jgi:CheY-like chemotaxis protein
MRKRRAIIYDDDLVILNVLRMFFELRGYDVIACREPVPCPVYIERGNCSNLAPCGDVILTDYRMPKMNGIELLEAQRRSGCKLTIRNKAVISGYFDTTAQDEVARLGCALFQKPMQFGELEQWLDGCERRMFLSQPLGFRRREARNDCYHAAFLKTVIREAKYDGMIVNRSHSGLCIALERAPDADDIMTVQADVPIGFSQAMVRWVKQDGQGKYLVGMSSH